MRVADGTIRKEPQRTVRALTAAAKLSSLYMMVPGALPLVPLTRFPGFVWIIAIGLALRSSAARSGSPSVPGRR